MPAKLYGEKQSAEYSPCVETLALVYSFSCARVIVEVIEVGTLQ